MFSQSCWALSETFFWVKLLQKRCCHVGHFDHIYGLSSTQCYGGSSQEISWLYQASLNSRPWTIRHQAVTKCKVFLWKDKYWFPKIGRVHFRHTAKSNRFLFTKRPVVLKSYCTTPSICVCTWPQGRTDNFSLKPHTAVLVWNPQTQICIMPLNVRRGAAA